MALAIVVVGYFATAAVLVLFPLASQTGNEPASVNGYVVSNGLHTDLVLPIRTAAVDWAHVFSPDDLPTPLPDASHIAIGWGDREFYLNTPRWQDLTPGRALRAVSGSGRTLLHVSYLREAELKGDGVHALPLTATQYAALVAYVEQSIARSAEGTAVVIAGRRYGAQDAFYEARGSYNLFVTCNVWTGRGLAAAGVRVSRWTPLASQVVWHLPLR